MRLKILVLVMAILLMPVMVSAVTDNHSISMTSTDTSWNNRAYVGGMWFRVYQNSTLLNATRHPLSFGETMYLRDQNNALLATSHYVGSKTAVFNYNLTANKTYSLTTDGNSAGSTTNYYKESYTNRNGSSGLLLWNYSHYSFNNGSTWSTDTDRFMTLTQIGFNVIVYAPPGDTTDPNVSLSSPVNGSSHEIYDVIWFNSSCTDDVNLSTCGTYILNSTFGAVLSNVTASLNGTSWTHNTSLNLTTLGAGTFYVNVSAVDDASNKFAALWTFTVTNTTSGTYNYSSFNIPSSFGYSDLDIDSTAGIFYLGLLLAIVIFLVWLAEVSRIPAMGFMAGMAISMFGFIIGWKVSLLIGIFVIVCGLGYGMGRALG